MADRIVVDTDVLVGVLRDDPGWKQRMATHQARARLLTTDINAFELYLGANVSTRRDRNFAAVQGLLGTFDVLHTSEASMQTAARLAAGLRAAGEPLDVKDLLIASIALVHGTALLTGNRRHFDRIPGLKVLGP